MAKPTTATIKVTLELTNSKELVELHRQLANLHSQLADVYSRYGAAASHPES